MAKRCGCRRNGGRPAGNAVREEPATEVRAEEETMPMCRYVNSVGRSFGCNNMERQLCQISQMLDQQGRMLAELLREVREQR